MCFLNPRLNPKLERGSVLPETSWGYLHMNGVGCVIVVFYYCRVTVYYSNSEPKLKMTDG